MLGCNLSRWWGSCQACRSCRPLSCIEPTVRPPHPSGLLATVRLHPTRWGTSDYALGTTHHPLWSSQPTNRYASTPRDACPACAFRLPLRCASLRWVEHYAPRRPLSNAALTRGDTTLPDLYPLVSATFALCTRLCTNFWRTRKTPTQRGIAACQGASPPVSARVRHRLNRATREDGSDGASCQVVLPRAFALVGAASPAACVALGRGLRCVRPVKAASPALGRGL